MAFVADFVRLMNSVADELSVRMRMMEETNTPESWAVYDELDKLRKSYYYRRKRYREDTSEENIKSYMYFIHGVVAKIAEVDARIGDDL